MSLNVVCSKCGYIHNVFEDMRRQKSYFGMVSDLSGKTLNCKCCNKVLIVVKPREVAKYVSTS